MNWRFALCSIQLASLLPLAWFLPCKYSLEFEPDTFLAFAWRSTSFFYPMRKVKVPVSWLQLLLVVAPSPSKYKSCRNPSRFCVLDRTYWSFIKIYIFSEHWCLILMPYILLVLPNQKMIVLQLGGWCGEGLGSWLLIRLLFEEPISFAVGARGWWTIGSTRHWPEYVHLYSKAFRVVMLLPPWYGLNTKYWIGLTFRATRG